MLFWHIIIVQSIVVNKDISKLFVSSNEDLEIDLAQVFQGQGLQYSLQSNIENDQIQLQGYFNATMDSVIVSTNRIQESNQFNRLISIVEFEYYVTFRNRTIEYYEINQNILQLYYSVEIQDIDYIYHIEKWIESPGQILIFFLCRNNTSTSIFVTSLNNGIQYASKATIYQQLENQILFKCLDYAFCVMSNRIGNQAQIYFIYITSTYSYIQNILQFYDNQKPINPVDLLLIGNSDYYFFIADESGFITQYYCQNLNSVNVMQMGMQQFNSKIVKLIKLPDQQTIGICTFSNLFVLDILTGWQYVFQDINGYNTNLVEDYIIYQQDETILASYELDNQQKKVMILQAFDLKSVIEDEEIQQVLMIQGSQQMLIRTSSNLIILTIESQKPALLINMLQNSTRIQLIISTVQDQTQKIAYPIQIQVNNNLYSIENRDGHYLAPIIDRNPQIKFITRSESQNFYLNLYEQFTGWNIRYNIQKPLNINSTLIKLNKVSEHVLIECDNIKQIQMFNSNQVWLITQDKYCVLNLSTLTTHSFNVVHQPGLQSIFTDNLEFPSYVLTGLSQNNTTKLYLVQSQSFSILSELDAQILCKKVQIRNYWILCSNYEIFQIYSYHQLIILKDSEVSLGQQTGQIIDLVWAQDWETIVLTKERNRLIFLDTNLNQINSIETKNNTISINLTDEYLVAITQLGWVSLYNLNYQLVSQYLLPLQENVESIQYSVNSILIQSSKQAFLVLMDSIQQRALFDVIDKSTLQSLFMYEQKQLISVDQNNNLVIYNLNFQQPEMSSVDLQIKTSPNSTLHGTFNALVKLTAQNEYNTVELPINITYNYNQIFPYFNSAYFTNQQNIELNYQEQSVIPLDQNVQGQNLFFEIEYESQQNQDYFATLQSHLLQIDSIQEDLLIYDFVGPIQDKYIVILLQDNILQVQEFDQDQFNLITSIQLKEVSHSGQQADKIKLVFADDIYILFLSASKSYGSDYVLFFYWINMQQNNWLQYIGQQSIFNGSVQDLVVLNLQSPSIAIIYSPLWQMTKNNKLFTTFDILTIDLQNYNFTTQLFDCSNLNTPVAYFKYFYAETMNHQTIAYLIDYNMNLYVYQYENGKMSFIYSAQLIKQVYALIIYKGQLYISDFECLHHYSIINKIEFINNYCYQQQWDGNYDLQFPIIEISQNETFIGMLLNKGKQFLYYQIFDLQSQQVVTMVSCQSKLQFTYGCLGKFLNDNIIATFTLYDQNIYLNQLKKPSITIPQLTYEQFKQLKDEKDQMSFYLTANNNLQFQGIKSSLITIKRIGELKKDSSSISVTWVVIISILSFTTVFLGITFGYIWLKKRRNRQESNPIRIVETFTLQDHSLI